jgi:hypothetical protein
VERAAAWSRATARKSEHAALVPGEDDNEEGCVPVRCGPDKGEEMGCQVGLG